MKGDQQYCKCGNGLLIVKIVEEENMVGLTCLECKKEFYLMTFTQQKVKRLNLNDVPQEKSE